MARERAVRLALWVVLAVLATRVLWKALSGAAGPTHGFVTYYTASRELLGGTAAERLYDDAWFRARVRQQLPTVADIYGPNLPTTALAATPLAWMSYRVARMIWAALHLALYAAALWWLARACGFNTWELPAWLTLGAVWQPALDDLVHGQAYVVMLLLCTMAWRCWESPGVRDRCLGLAVGVMLVLKAAGLLLWPVLAAARRWRAVLSGVAVALAVCVATLPLLGLEAWRVWAARLATLTAHPSLSVTAYQAQLGFGRRLFVEDPQWNPEPVFDARFLGVVVPVMLFAGSAFLTLWAARRAPRSDAVFAASVLLTLMGSPVSLEYHYTMALLPVGIVLARVRLRLAQPIGLLAIAAVLALGGDLPYRSAELTGPLVLLAYPRLYGAAVLWAIALFLAVRDPSARDDRRPV